MKYEYDVDGEYFVREDGLGKKFHINITEARRIMTMAHNCPLRPNISNFNAILKMLKVEFPFLREGESTSQQQVLIDLIKAFSRFFKNISGHPNFKSKKNAHPSFRIQKNGK